MQTSAAACMIRILAAGRRRRRIGYCISQHAAPPSQPTALRHVAQQHAVAAVTAGFTEAGPRAEEGSNRRRHSAGLEHANQRFCRIARILLLHPRRNVHFCWWRDIDNTVFPRTALAHAAPGRHGPEPHVVAVQLEVAPEQVRDHRGAAAPLACAAPRHVSLRLQDVGHATLPKESQLLKDFACWQSKAMKKRQRCLVA